MSALFEIVAEYREQLARLADMDAPPEAVIDTIEALQAPIEDKVRAVLRFTRNLEVLATARSNEARRLSESAERLERRIESLHSYVQACLSASGVRLPLQFPEFDVNLAKLPPSCDVTNPDKLPEEYLDKSATIDLNDERCAVLPQKEGGVLIGYTINVPAGRIEFSERPKKREVLSALKAGAAVPGAKLNPVGYRLTVK